ncbi:MAG: glycosyltransferase family 8 protein [Proteobacteria bacterium]|nr:glycosyltransferase family 8 protein [Pseudomonadota bacterium]MBU4469955.1 glycosyltransferase family 8 protein [Pseudomonadota bacterium]MCG2753717.1 glycosyltransferase family 8 protein [Desulfobacteraceae bacterium]
MRPFEEKVNIVFCCDDRFLPYTSTAILSLVEHADKKRDYCIHLFHESIPGKRVDKVKKELSAYSNVQIETHDMKGSFKGSFISRHLSKASYYRLAIPRMLKNCHRAIYLDSDIIVLSDVSRLYDFDLGGSCIAGAQDSILLFGARSRKVPEMNNMIHYDYLAEYLKLSAESIPLYINSGVLLMDLDKIRQSGKDIKLLEGSKKKYAMLDQDVINSIFRNDDHQILSYSWNYPAVDDYPEANYLKESSTRYDKYYRDFFESKNDLKILHYIGRKPWQALGRKQGYNPFFWQFAQKSIFCMEISMKRYLFLLKRLFTKRFRKELRAVLRNQSTKTT